jgi:hypothetical protein
VADPQGGFVPKLSISAATQLASSLLEAAGVPRESARAVASHLVDADACGYPSHGLSHPMTDRDRPRAHPRRNRPAQSIAASLRAILASQKTRLTLQEIATHVEGDGGLGPALLVLTLPELLPLPPGASMILGLPVLIVAVQIVLGRPRLWLPQWLARQSIKQAALNKLLQRVLPLLVGVEKLARPRWPWLTRGLGRCVTGLACTVIALALILPIPFANLLPALALGLFALGLTRKDGLFILFGFGLLFAAASLVLLAVNGISAGVHEIRSLF